jgi:hypothetical protein
VSAERKPIAEVLSVEAVLAAYKAKNLNPVIGDWGDGKTCACAAGAVLACKVDDIDRVLNDVWDQDDPQFKVAEYLGVRTSELRCFVDGFDNNDAPPEKGSSRDAYDLGQAVARAVGVRP